MSRAAADPLCRRALATFKHYLGSVTGNIALTLMATGGVFLCGGVAPRIVDAGGAAAIVESFLDKGRMSKVLERIPVYLVRDGNLALKGAAHTAMRLVKRDRDGITGHGPKGSTVSE